jgi:hypothetical protein
VPCIAESRGDFSSKMKHIVGNKVGKITGLGMSPHVFRRVEFGGVWREPLDLESGTVPRLQGSHCGAVRAEPVDDEGDRPVNLAQQPGDEEIAFSSRSRACRSGFCCVQFNRRRTCQIPD